MKETIDLPTHFENEFISIKYISGKNYILEAWKDFGEDDKIKLAKNKLTEMFKSTKTSAYVSDLTGFKGASPEVQRWVRDVWFPEVYNAGLRTLAMLVTEDIFANFSVNTAINGDYSKKITLEKFKTTEEAEKWFKEVI
ncbi:MAG: hypothetical protein GQ564_14640 [Bacteroidales bacterium]|nr:hypothetical protein [Bacteroidales bacterium]